MGHADTGTGPKLEGAMAAAWLWARADLRRRWRGVVLLALLLGLAGGFALTALVGARRASTGWDRFRAETLAPDAFVSIPSRNDPRVGEELGALPGVEEVTSFVYVEVAPSGMEEGGAFAAVDDRLGRSINRWRVLEGRRADPRRADEIVVNQAMAELARLRAGDPVTLADAEGTFSTEATVVGVVVGTLDLSQNASYPGAYLTPAFLARYGDAAEIGRQNQFVRLARGAAGLGEFSSAVARQFGEGGGTLVGGSAEEDVPVRQALALQAWALYLMAAAAAAATLVALGQALARHVSAAAGDAGALESLGMTRVQRAAANLPAVALVVGAGTALSVAVALVASPLVPPGLAGQVERHRGVTTDLVALAGGGAVLA
ncbi:MAG: hypothetical protein M3179_12085, partial [Actinomycetota bacterium]|nr:hypothetical protein [Actinomycetota bacterium]